MAVEEEGSASGPPELSWTVSEKMEVHYKVTEKLRSLELSWTVSEGTKDNQKIVPQHEG